MDLEEVVVFMVESLANVGIVGEVWDYLSCLSFVLFSITCRTPLRIGP